MGDKDVNSDNWNVPVRAGSRVAHHVTMFRNVVLVILSIWITHCVGSHINLRFASGDLWTPSDEVRPSAIPLASSFWTDYAGPLEGMGS